MLKEGVLDVASAPCRQGTENRRLSRIVLGCAGLLLGMVSTQAQAQDANAVDRVAGQNDAQRIMGSSIDGVCPTLVAQIGANPALANTPTGELQRVCSGMIQNARTLLAEGGPVGFNIADEEAFNGAVQSIAGEEMMTPQLEISKVRNNQVGAIRGRLSALRATTATSQLSLGSYFDPSREYQVAQAGGDIPVLEEASAGRLGVFVTGGYRFGEKDDTDQSEAFDFDNAGITAGIDYRLTPNSIIGMAFGYSAFNVDFDDTVDSPDGQEIENDTFSLSLYGTYYGSESLFVDGIVRGGYGAYDSRRHIFISNPGGVDVDGDTIPDGDIDRNADGDFNSWFVDVGVRGGYDLTFGAATITPNVGVDYVYADIDGFTEEGAGGLNLKFEDQQAQSLTTSIGASAAYAISLGSGVLTPSVNAAWIFELTDDDDGVEFSYAADTTPGTLSGFEVAVEDKDSNFGQLGAGLALALPNDFSAFVDYSTIVALEDLEQHSLFFGIRKGF